MQLTQQELQREGQQSSTEPSVANTHRNSRAGDNIIYGIFSSKKRLGKAYSNSSIKSSFLRHFLPAARSSRAVASCAAPAVGLSLMGRPRPFEPTFNSCSFCVGGGVNSTPRYALRVINCPSALFKAERIAMSQGSLQPA